MRQLAMWREIATVVVGLALVLVAIGVVFFVGMRTRSPLVRNVVRRFNRAFGNPHQMKTAGTPGAYASVIRHVGRKTGRSYETPMVPFATEDGFVIALPYGSGTDWAGTSWRAGPPLSSMKGTRTGSISRNSFPQPWPRPTCRPRSNGNFAGSPSTNASGFAAWSQGEASGHRRIR